jgi:hypothetical protein
MIPIHQMQQSVLNETKLITKEELWQKLAHVDWQIADDMVQGSWNHFEDSIQ